MGLKPSFLAPQTERSMPVSSPLGQKSRIMFMSEKIAKRFLQSNFCGIIPYRFSCPFLSSFHEKYRCFFHARRHWLRSTQPCRRHAYFFFPGLAGWRYQNLIASCSNACEHD
jgi:hypothetical protein